MQWCHIKDWPILVVCCEYFIYIAIHIGGASSEQAHTHAHKLYWITQWNKCSESECTGWELLSQFSQFLSELATQLLQWIPHQDHTWTRYCRCLNHRHYASTFRKLSNRPKMSFGPGLKKALYSSLGESSNPVQMSSPVVHSSSSVQWIAYCLLPNLTAMITVWVEFGQGFPSYNCLLVSATIWNSLWGGLHVVLNPRIVYQQRSWNITPYSFRCQDYHKRSEHDWTRRYKTKD